MTRLIIIAVVFLAAFTAASGQNPTPTPPSQMVPIDIVSVGDGAKVLRTVDFSGQATVVRLNGIEPTFVQEMARTRNGSLVILAQEKILVVDGAVHSYDIPNARYFVATPTEPDSFEVALANRSSGVKRINAVQNGVFVMNMPNEQGFYENCTKSHVNGADVYCLDADNGKLFRARPVGFSPAKLNNPELVYEQKGLVAARPYKDGLLMLVASMYECAQDNAVQIPDSVVFCYFSGMCPQVSFSTLLFLDGSGKVTEVTKDVSINRGATLAVIGDLVYVVESRYDEKRNWLGDFVSRISVSTGKKGVYFSPEMYTSLWIN